VSGQSDAKAATLGEAARRAFFLLEQPPAVRQIDSHSERRAGARNQTLDTTIGQNYRPGADRLSTDQRDDSPVRRHAGGHTRSSELAGEGGHKQPLKPTCGGEIQGETRRASTNTSRSTCRRDIQEEPQIPHRKYDAHRRNTVQSLRHTRWFCLSSIRPTPICQAAVCLFTGGHITHYSGLRVTGQRFRPGQYVLGWMDEKFAAKNILL